MRFESFSNDTSSLSSLLGIRDNLSILNPIMAGTMKNSHALGNTKENSKSTIITEIIPEIIQIIAILYMALFYLFIVN